MPGQLEGRRIFFVGIGGAGLSGYALLAKAWGAEVTGWDRVETPYLAALSGVEIDISPEPRAPEGWEVVVSTAYTERLPGKSRAEFLSELVSLQPSLVVAGTHGKSTTAAMIAFCLDQLGHDPAFLIGAEVPQLGGSARAGTGWLVVEGDESDRTIASLRPHIAVVTNVELDHHSTFASRTELEEMFERWLAEVPQVVRCEELDPVEIVLGPPGEHNRRNAACALAGLELAGVPRVQAAPVLAAFRGLRRRFERRGEAAGVPVYDDYGHHPTEVAATIAAARGLTRGRVLVLFQPHLPSRTVHLASEFGAALAAADVVCITEVYGAREELVEGVTGKLVVDALSEHRPGMTVGWAPALEDGTRFLARHARPGDIVLTIGAGDVERAVPLLLGQLG